MYGSVGRLEICSVVELAPDFGFVLPANEYGHLEFGADLTRDRVERDAVVAAAVDGVRVRNPRFTVHVWGPGLFISAALHDAPCHFQCDQDDRIERYSKGLLPLRINND